VPLGTVWDVATIPLGTIPVRGPLEGFVGLLLLHSIIFPVLDLMDYNRSKLPN